MTKEYYKYIGPDTMTIEQLFKCIKHYRKHGPALRCSGAQHEKRWRNKAYKRYLIFETGIHAM